MQMEVSLICTILNDQQWERIAPKLPGPDDQNCGQTLAGQISLA